MTFSKKSLLVLNHQMLGKKMKNDKASTIKKAIKQQQQRHLKQNLFSKVPYHSKVNISFKRCL